MKYLLQAHSLADSAELQLIKRMLEQMRIACMIRNENLIGAMGEIPFTQCYPELWLLDQADLSRAEAALAQWRQACQQPQAVWVCEQCAELIDGQFGACWQCGKERDMAAR